MSQGCFVSSAALAALVVAMLAPAPAAAQTLSPAVKTAAGRNVWTPPRTPDGHPDLQGVWTTNTVTPMERPKELAGKEFYTDAELAALTKSGNLL